MSIRLLLYICTNGNAPILTNHVQRNWSLLSGLGIQFWCLRMLLFFPYPIFLYWLTKNRSIFPFHVGSGAGNYSRNLWKYQGKNPYFLFFFQCMIRFITIKCLALIKKINPWIVQKKNPRSLMYCITISFPTKNRFSKIMTTTTLMVLIRIIRTGCDTLDRHIICGSWIWWHANIWTTSISTQPEI